MTLSELKKSLESCNSKLLIMKARRDKLLEDKTSKEERLEIEKDDKFHTNQASLLLKSQAADTRKSALEAIDDMTTQAIKPMFGDDYSFKFDYDSNALDKGLKSGFNITPKITSLINGQPISTSIKESRGGGLIEVMSVLLRFSFLKLIGYNGLIILDETWVSVSNDEKLKNLIKFLDSYIEESNIQVLLVTHRAELFGKISNNILKVYKEDGIGKCIPITYDELIDGMKMLE